MFCKRLVWAIRSAKSRNNYCIYFIVYYLIMKLILNGRNVKCLYFAAAIIIATPFILYLYFDSLRYIEIKIKINICYACSLLLELV